MKKLLFFFLVWLILLDCSAQQDKSLLWEISGNGLAKSSYVFGTMHIMRKNDFFITETTKEKLIQSECFVTEIDMKVSLVKQLELAKKMYLPEGKTLQNYVSDEDFTFFKNYLIDSLKMKKSKFEKYIRLKPFFLSSLLTVHVAGKVKAYEKELYKIAKNKGIPSDGLESFDFQYSLIEATPIEEQAKTLIKEVRNFKNTRQMLNDMIEIYKQQDIDKLYEIIMKSETSDAEFNENFIFKRNQSWIPLIEEKIARQSCFIAVGAAHLPGENGILNLLKQKGYTVKPIK